MATNLDNIIMFAPFKRGAFTVTSPYGPRPSLGDYHNGIDLVGLDGDTLVCAVMGGKVAQSRIITNKNNRTWEWGNYIAIKQDDGVTAYYCHLAERRVQYGHKVSAGQVIGVMGNTGYSLGPHLHFEVRNSKNTAFDSAVYLGIDNIAGAVIEVPVQSEPALDFAVLVCRKCGLEEQTKKYIDKYKYADALWAKLYKQMI